jgi:hypothetical protein
MNEEAMSVLDRLACAQGRRDETPNQELAHELAERGDQEDIRELVANLHHADQDVRSDGIKTLYEVGYLKPELVAEYAAEFLRLLRDRLNRMVWGALLALATIAPLRADDLYKQRQRVLDALAEGSVITVDNGVKVLVAAADDAHRAELLPYLFQPLQTCRPKDVPPHAEAIVRAVDAAHWDACVAVLERRLAVMNATQAARLRRVIRQVEGVKRTS